MKINKISYIVLLALISYSPIAISGPKPIILDEDYHHDLFKTQPKDIVKEFRAYTSSFDSKDDNDGDGIGEALGHTHQPKNLYWRRNQHRPKFST